MHRLIRVLALLVATTFAPLLAAQTSSGTLAKIRDTRAIALGYRTDATPFSFADRNGQPAGYTVDLCNRIGERTIHPLDHDRVVAAVNASRVTGEPISLEHRMVAPDGTVTWFAHEVIKIPDATGTVQWFEGIMLDVTARKQAEHDLVDLNRRTVETLENMLEGCFVLDAAGISVYVDPSATKLLGKTRDELIGRNVFEVYPETVDTVFYEEFQRVRADRVARQVEGYSPPINRWLNAHMSPSGDGYAVLFEDVTERHERDVAAMSDVLNALNRHADPAAAWRDVAAALRRLTGCTLSALHH